MASLVQSVLDSLQQPGLNAPMQKAMHLSFFGLFLTLFALLVMTNGNFHLWALIAITAGLYGSVNWFLRELSKLPPSTVQIQQMPQPERPSETDSTIEHSQDKKQR